MTILHKKLAGSRRLLNRIVEQAKSQHGQREKYREEEEFWVNLVRELVLWYEGEIPERRQVPSPSEEQKIKCYLKEHSAILTWFELHQKPKYAADLQLPLDVFRGIRVLDVGSGPFPSAEIFELCELYCLDPLLPQYINAGYPLHYYEARTRFVHGRSEKMPFAADFFGAVISVNAIDHVDDINLTAREIERVLVPGGKLRLHVHYHKRTPTEPLELNDSVMQEAFRWCRGLEKISENKEKMGATAGPGETYSVWGNF